MIDQKRPKGPFDVKRKIPLAPTKPDKMKDAIDHLKAIEPIIDAKVDQRSNLHMAYDASCVSIRDIESLLNESGISLAPGMLCRLKSSWYRFLDGNTRSNALSKGGACCSRPPPGAGDTGKVRD
jgi:hypothetical protein